MLTDVSVNIRFFFDVQINHQGELRQFQWNRFFDAEYIKKYGIVDCHRRAEDQFAREFCHVLMNQGLLYNTIIGELKMWYVEDWAGNPIMWMIDTDSDGFHATPMRV